MDVDIHPGDNPRLAEEVDHNSTEIPIEGVGGPNFPIHTPGAMDPVGQLIARRPTRKRRSILVIVGACWLVLIGGLALTAPVLPLRDPAGISSEVKLRPGFRFHEPLGTDALGRSQLSRVINGARVSLSVGIMSTIIGIVIGILVGVIAGYFGGRIDAVLLILIDALLAFPPLVLLLALVSVLTPSLKNVILALGFLAIPSFARIGRANTLVMSRREFVMASRVMGANHVRVLSREILPNVVIPILAFGFLVVASLMIAEGSLSFLGLGIPPPQPSWGGMIASGQPSLQTAPHLVFVPAAMLFLTVFSLNAVGDRVRARFENRSSSL